MKPYSEAEGKDKPGIKYSNERDYNDGFQTSDHRDATKGRANRETSNEFNRSDKSETGLIDREPL